MNMQKKLMRFSKFTDLYKDRNNSCGGWDDALFVPAFSIGYKAEFLHTQDISHGLGGFFLC